MPPRLIFPTPDWRALAATVPTVTPAFAFHAHVAGSPAVTFVPAASANVAPESCVHAHVAGEPAVSFVPAGVSIDPDDAFHAHVAGEPTVTFVAAPSGAALLAAAIDAEGWQVTHTLEGLSGAAATPLTGWNDLKANWTLSVTGPGFDTSGNFSASRVRTIRGTGGVQKLYIPGVHEPAELDQSEYDFVVSGADLLAKSATSRRVYAGETATLTAAGGYFTGAAAVSGFSVTNNSTNSYEKPLADLIEFHNEHVTGTFKIRAVAHHVEARNGRPLAAMKIIATPWNNATNAPKDGGVVVTKLAAYEWSGLSGLANAGRGSAIYAPEFSESDFDPADIPGPVRFTFEDCPWVGDQQRSADYAARIDPNTASWAPTGNALGEALRPVVKWVGAVPTPRHVYVAIAGNALGITGNDGTGAVASTFAAAKAAPFATFNAARQALFTASTDPEGAKIWLTDGVINVNNTGVSVTTRRAREIAIEVLPDPLVTNPTVNCVFQTEGATRHAFFTQGTGNWTSFVIFRRVRFLWTASNVGHWSPANSNRTMVLGLDGCHIQNDLGASTTLFFNGTLLMGRDCTMNAATGGILFPAVNTSSLPQWWHNCEANRNLIGNVIWGLRSSQTATASAYLLGTTTGSLLRATNLLAGYVWWPNLQAGAPNVRAAAKGDQIANVMQMIAQQHDDNLSRVIQVGELEPPRTWRHLCLDHVTSYVQGFTTLTRLGANIQDEPDPRPTVAPGQNYVNCSFSCNNLWRWALKGSHFMAVNGNGSPSPATAALLTGMRAIAHGCGTGGTHARSTDRNNQAHMVGVAGRQGVDVAVDITYADASIFDLRPTGNYLPIPADLMMHGLDITGAAFALDGTDPPGCFVKA